MAKGEITHVEFPADDPERAKRFYAAVAGWEFGEQPGMEGYFLFQTEERHGGAIGKRGETIGPRAAHLHHGRLAGGGLCGRRGQRRDRHRAADRHRRRVWSLRGRP